MKLSSQIEQTLGGLKFAMVLLILFSLAMAVGTFCESYFGTEFANRALYKTPPFMALQLAMFLCITFAALLRFPPRKRLYGFYTVHAGLIIVGAGSFITYYAGIDGHLPLLPQTPSRDIILDDDVLKIHYLEEGKVVSYRLPYTPFPKHIGQSYQNVKILDYLPYAEKKFSWREPSGEAQAAQHSGVFLLANPNVQEKFTLSLHPEATDFKSNLNLGPLSIQYLPSGLATCFVQNNPSQLILWDSKNQICDTPEKRGISLQKTRGEAGKGGKRFFVIRETHADGEKIYSFFPDLSPWPMDENFQVHREAPFRVFNKKMFEQKPYLFLFGEHAAFYDKEEEKWQSLTLKKGHPAELPWMGFELTLLDHQTHSVPAYHPVYTTPIQKNGEFVRGGTRAIQIEIEGEKHWVTRETPVKLTAGGKLIGLQLLKSSLRLPFEFVLTKFKMDKNPGTDDPASYESFVKLFTEDGPRDAHIFMNNPLKYQGLTFYQASYSVDEQGNYSSTLSVNYDPGRFWKYLGCLMLVLGSIWHYRLNRRVSHKAPAKFSRPVPLVSGN